MFALFFSLYYAMLTGFWTNFDYGSIFQSGTANTALKNVLNSFGKLLTSIFSDGLTYDTLGNDFINGGNVISLLAFVLALITSIGIVVVAVKGIKRVFGVFFMGIR